ncbi:hypothetical protein UPYG_G00296310 [Umbra pygmaea]|uniref:Uncharacterized protein n=1 Tax=Umbra pygmaea TaxID=75934 RepID=A0ABD0W5P7_UMBPY
MIFVIPSATTAAASFVTMARSKSSKSSGNFCNLVIAVLTLWFLVSLIVIVLWAKSSHSNGAAQCKIAQQALEEEIEEANVLWEKDQQYLEEVMRLSQENQTSLKKELEEAADRLAETNVFLSICLEVNGMLRKNETALRNVIDLHRETQINLSLALSQQRDHVEVLQLNFTLAVYQSHSCFASCDASNSQTMSARSQMKACESSKQYLITKIERRGCKLDEGNCDRVETKRVATKYRRKYSLYFAVYIYLLTKPDLKTPGWFGHSSS